MFSLIRPAFVSLALFTVITGVLYPAAVTGAAQALFPAQANGSLLEDGDRVVGSALVGQPFSSPKYFWCRPSATGVGGSAMAYNGAASTGSNWGPLNPKLADAVKARVAALRAADPGNTAPIPVDLVTMSGSGLDPHISPAAALYQAPRVARARALPEDRVRALVAEVQEGRQLGVLGEPRVNVVRLNLALDRIKS